MIESWMIVVNKILCPDMRFLKDKKVCGYGELMLTIKDMSECQKESCPRKLKEDK